MRIVFVSSGLFFAHGGPAISESELVRNLRSRHDVTVLCPKVRFERSFAEGAGLEVKLFDGRDAVRAWAQRTWLRQLIGTADVMHMNGHWRWENHFLARLAVRFHVPYVVHPRGMCLVDHRRIPLKKLFNTLVGNYIVRNASRIVVLSRFEERHLLPYGVPERRMSIIPNGIQVPAVQPGRIPHLVEQEYFLYLGRIEARKNLIFLMDAYARYWQRGGRAALVLVGPEERGYARRVRARAEELGVDSQVHLLPPVYGPEKWVHLSRALAVVYPSMEEPFGRVPFEAVSVGALPIVPDRSGGAEYLHRWLESAVYRHDSADSLAECMETVESGRRQGRDLGLGRARAWVRTELAWGAVARQVEAVYAQITGRPAPAAAADSVGA